MAEFTLPKIPATDELGHVFKQSPQKIMRAPLNLIPVVQYICRIFSILKIGPISSMCHKNRLFLSWAMFYSKGSLRLYLSYAKIVVSLNFHLPFTTFHNQTNN